MKKGLGEKPNTQQGKPPDGGRNNNPPSK